MQNEDIVERLEYKDVKPTANRILVYKSLDEVSRPLSLNDLEELLPSLDKSSIFRVLNLFAEHDVVHSFSDGRGIVHYEICQHDGVCEHNNDHVHFYCEHCRQSYCIEDLHVPTISLPEGFSCHEISFIVKGLCSKCSNR